MQHHFERRYCEREIAAVTQAAEGATSPASETSRWTHLCLLSLKAS